MSKVLIAVPTHGAQISGITAKTVQMAASSTHDVKNMIQGSSLLAHNFNLFFCLAFKKGYDYLIYLHSDISVSTSRDSPYGSWVDLLVARTHQLGVAALSVVSPIKSPDGYTSTGLILNPSNPYGVRRITVKELDRLPIEFISRQEVCCLFGVDPDTAGALVVNTGALCIDLKNYDWSKWTGFTISDEIIWSLDNVPDCRVTPEDWNFSIYMHNRGLPYYATRELLLNHGGFTAYTNYASWGKEHDECELKVDVETYKKSYQKKEKHVTENASSL